MRKNYIGNLRKAWLILKAMPTEGGSAKAALGPDRNHRLGDSKQSDDAENSAI